MNWLVKYFKKRRTIRDFKKLSVNEIILVAKMWLADEEYEKMDNLLKKVKKYRPDDLTVIKTALNTDYWFAHERYIHT